VPKPDIAVGVRSSPHRRLRNILARSWTGLPSRLSSNAVEGLVSLDMSLRGRDEGRFSGCMLTRAHQILDLRGRRAMKWTTTVGTAFVMAILGTNVAAQTAVSDRVRNIEKAAAEIGAIQKKSGSDGAFAAINECYKRELVRATALTPQLEACMTQDIIVSQVTAAVYSRISAEGRRMAGGEEPDAVLKAMRGRVVGTMARFKVPQDDALVFNGIVKTRGMEAYGRAQFPDQFPAKN
jgi:hypothetical protein